MDGPDTGTDTGWCPTAARCPGFVSQFVRFVDDGVTVAVLTNGDDVDIESIARGVAMLHLPVAVGGAR